MNFEDKSKIEELKKSLYSRTSPDIKTKRRLHFIKNDLEGIKTDWEHPVEEKEEVELNEKYVDHSMSFFNKFLIGSFNFSSKCDNSLLSPRAFCNSCITPFSIPFGPPQM
jgi:hypothetical protein